MFDEWFRKNKAAFINFGDMFVALLSDNDTVLELAKRDLEKLARIFKLIFFAPIADETASAERLAEILAYLNAPPKGGETD